MQPVDNLDGWNARRDRVHRSVTDYLVGINHEDGWFGDAASFSRVVDVPVLDHASFRVAQNWKRQCELGSQGLRCFARIHRNSHQARARRPDFRIVFAIIRQLAEAKRSPIPAIEEQNQSPLLGDQLGQPPGRACRVQQLEVPHNFPSDRNFCHGTILVVMAKECRRFRDLSRGDKGIGI